MALLPPRKEDDFFSRCEQTIKKYGMLAPGETVLVGTSGGPDSMALVHVLTLLGQRSRYRIGIAHLNHGLRGPAADQDAQFVENLAKKLDLPYYFEKIELVAERDQRGGCLEEAGREARYRFFNRIADGHGYDKIAVGHNRDDDAELILMNLLRGSGPVGISGIPPVRDRVIRPLIHISRQDILAFLQRHQIAFVLDHTNENTAFRRNHIRHRLIPALRSYNPKVVETLSRLGEVLRSENDWIESLVESMMETVVLHRTGRTIVLDGKRLEQFETAPGRRIIRQAIREVKGDLRRIDFSHVAAILALLGKGNSPAYLDLPDRIRVSLTDGRLILAREKKSLRSAELSGRQGDVRPYLFRIPRQEAEAFELWIEPMEAWLVLNRMPRKHLDTFFGPCAAVMDWDRLAFPLEVRNRRAGDRFMPLGMNGTQKLKDFFVNRKIPGPERDRIPLVISGGQIVWVAGHRIDERVKVTETTQTVLKAELVSATDKYTHTCGGFSFERL